jgi:hypothetical protein
MGLKIKCPVRREQARLKEITAIVKEPGYYS